MEEQQQEAVMTDNSKSSSGGKWSCSLCTYNNIDGQLRCDLCNTPRYSSREEAQHQAIQQQAQLLSRQWSCSTCTFQNIQSATQCVKCETARPDHANADSKIVAANNRASSQSPPNQNTSKSRSNSPPQQIADTSCCSQQQTPPKILTAASNTPTSTTTTNTSTISSSNSDECDLIATSSATYKWKCPHCTYLNFPSALRCTMCRAPWNRANKIEQVAPRIPKEIYKPAPMAPMVANFQEARPFMVVGSLSRYMHSFIGQNYREDLFFRAVASIVTKDPNALNAVVNYLVHDGNVDRALNHFEAIIVYDYAVNVAVVCGDTLAVLARRCGLFEVQKLLERVSRPEDNLPCAAASPSSDVYTRIYHIFHFCRPPYKIPFRAYNFNIFRLPFPKTDFTNHLLNEILQPKIDPLMKQSLLRYVQISPIMGQDVRLSTVLCCPSSLVMKNRGANNSFFDAVMQAMFGVCDRIDIIREQLHDHLNSHAEWYKPGFIRQYRRMASQLGICLSDFEVEDLWHACASVETAHPPEPIHVFALAHLIARPIVILPTSTPIELSKRPRNLLSLANSRSNAYHYLEGFYVPYFAKSELFTRSPICLIHENGQFYNWITNDELAENCQNFIIVNYPRNQLTQLFRFLDDLDEKHLRSYLNLIQLTPNSVAIRHSTQDECIPEVTTFYFDYLTAAEETLKNQQVIRTVDVIRQMARNFDVPNNASITKLFSQRAKRLLSRHVAYESATSGDSDDSLIQYAEVDADETATKMPKVDRKKANK